MDPGNPPPAGQPLLPRGKRQARGRQGEEAAQRFLEAQGFRIVDVNIRLPRAYETPGELDIVAWERQTLCFIEVKTRYGAAGDVTPAEAVTPAKQRQIARLANAYLAHSGLLNDASDLSCRFDVVSVWLKRSAAPDTPETVSRIELVREAFIALSE
ncbi:MAG: hypothetical protein OHK0029_37740 [Armatimonadaceae bacterium]